MTKEERKVIEECVKAVRIYEKAAEFGFRWAKMADVVEGLAITATKLENLLTEGK